MLVLLLLLGSMEECTVDSLLDRWFASTGNRSLLGDEEMKESLRSHTPRPVQHQAERPASSASFYYTLPTPPLQPDDWRESESRFLTSPRRQNSAAGSATTAEERRARHLASAGVIFTTLPTQLARDDPTLPHHRGTESQAQHWSLPPWPFSPPADEEYQAFGTLMSSGGAGSSGSRRAVRMETDHEPQAFPPPATTARRRSRTAGDAGAVRGIGGQSGEGQAGDRAAATVAAAGGGGASGSRPSVAALAAAVGPKTTDKSCRNCRTRKVKVRPAVSLAYRFI